MARGLVTAAALLVAGCATPGRLDLKPGPTGPPPAAAERDLAVRVEQALAVDPVLRDAVILAEAHAGRVTLSGVVPTWQARRHAIEAALAVPGVLSVRSRLTVAPP